MSKRTFNGLLNVGLENEEDAVVPVMGEETEGQNDPIVDEVLTADETVEAGEGDIIEAEGEVEEAAGALNELETAAEELEDVETALEAFIEEGGMNAQTAIALGITVKRLNHKLGRSPLMNMPSNESFGGTAARLAATKDSLEAVKETKERVVAAIKKWFEVARQALKNFWIKIWDNSPRLKARLDALAKASERVKGEPKSDTVKVSARDLHIGGKVPSDLVKALKETVDETVTFLASSSDHDKEKQDAWREVIRELSTGAGASVQGLEIGMAADLKMIFDKGISSDKVKGAPAGYVIAFQGPELLGGKRVFKGAVAEGTNFTKVMSHRSGLVTVSPEADSKASEIEALPTLSPGDIDKACQEAMRGCDAVTNYRRKFDRREAFFKQAEQTVEQSFKVAADSAGENKDAEKVASEIQKAARKVTQSAMGAYEQLARHMLTVAKAVGTYGAASLKAYSGEDKESSEETSSEAAA